MIKVTILAGDTNVVRAPETKSIREILEEEDVVYQGRTISINGYCVPRDPSALDQTLADYGVTERCSISITAKSDNAADATVTGSALVVTSALKLDDLKTVKKYRPKALRLYEENDGRKEETFRIELYSGTGELDKNGAVYGDTVNAEGKAQITIMLDDVAADAVKDDFGPALLKLAKLEGTLGAAMEEIAAEKAEIEGHIHFN